MDYNSELYDKWSEYFLENYINKNNIKMIFLSENININESTIMKNLDLKWNIKNLCYNTSLSYDFLDNLIKKDIIEYTESQLLDYNYNIAKHPNFRINNINDNINIYKYSLNPLVTWDDIIKNPNFQWDYGYISRNINISIKNIIENMDLGWDFCAIVRNPIFHISHIKDNRTFYKRRTEYFSNPNFDLKEYNEYCPITSIKDINSDIHVNENFSIKMHDDIKKMYPDFIFNYSTLSDKKNITIEYILSTPQYEWDIENISVNPNLKLDFIKSNDYKWNYENICKNTFDVDREKYIRKLLNNL